MSEDEAALSWSEWARRKTDVKAASKKPEALDDTMVLDVGYGSNATLFASSILGEFGAEVVRLEPPDGDMTRRFSPFGYTHLGSGLGCIVEGRNKFHATVNLGSAEGRELFAKLAAKADVIIEAFRPGEMDSWGVGYRQLREVNPRLIYLAIYTYGQFGPRAQGSKPDIDVADQALSGLMSLTGQSEEEVGPQPYAGPTKEGNWMAWYVAGGFGALAVLAALHVRQGTGRGQMIDVSPAEALMRLCSYEIPYYHAFKLVRERIGNRDVAVYPYTYVRTKDGYAFLAGYTDDNFAALTTIMDRPDLRERFPTIFDRLTRANQKVLQDEIEKWSTALTYQEIAERVFAYKGRGVVGVGELQTPERVVKERHWWEREAFVEFDDPTYGRLLVQAPPWKMSETPPRLKWICRRVGQDNEYVYTKHLGLSLGRLKELRERGVL